MVENCNDQLGDMYQKKVEFPLWRKKTLSLLVTSKTVEDDSEKSFYHRHNVSKRNTTQTTDIAQKSGILINKEIHTTSKT